ncbi:hypothetical protein [Polymorphum gilvum]|uniref:Uncharacterized protein n=1 Tax=Polymorphum gilvum (strain LMG 25793 / CGMCC 1.9160 / SL003B-26A1) TaxID=991905 RepID=F2IX98_POLGS|nr:hypothetical protein [Polymorphum gilvum]ADZ70416.1 hypothetical protein SL003B_1990 [Polymorphum gilvum SL003B-26A1]
MHPSSVSRYLPEHACPSDTRLSRLRREVEVHQLTDMWDMILTVDFQVCDARNLPRATRDEFCDIVELLVRAFTR